MDLDALQQRCGCVFRDQKLLRLALTHPSVAHEHGAAAEDNQRLEFLGDAVLQLILTEDLYHRFHGAGEGPLTKARAKLVNARFLAEQGRRLGLGECLIMGRGEDMHGGRARPSALADAFEAVLGAFFIDSGFGAVREFVLRQFQEELTQITPLPTLENPKGELQEMIQAGSSETLEYRLESSSGPDHDRLFECAVYHKGAELGRGSGKSKKTAESEAALAALLRLRAEAPKDKAG